MSYPKAILVLIALPLLLIGCSKAGGNSNGTPTIKSDFSTPEGAILRLEDAYRAKDIEAAVGCKDFRIEARLMLEKFKNLQINDEVIDKTAEALEIVYRRELEQKGFPDMQGVTSTFPKQEPYPEHENIVMVTEVCLYPDGGASKEKLLAAKTAKGWRVLNPVD
jgi:hypothetical protein